MSSDVQRTLDQMVQELAEYVFTEEEKHKMITSNKRKVLIVSRELKRELNRTQKDQEYKPKGIWQKQKQKQKQNQKYKQKEYCMEAESSSNSKSKKARSKNYTSYSYDFKSILVAEVRQLMESSNLKMSKAINIKANQYKIHPKNITRWMNSEDLREKRGNRKAQFPEMEQKLKAFCLKHPAASRISVVKWAKVLIHQFNYDSEAIKGFTFSKGWFQRFRERHGLRPPKKKQEKSQSQESSDNAQNFNDTEDPIADNLRFLVKIQEGEDMIQKDYSGKVGNEQGLQKKGEKRQIQFNELPKVNKHKK